MATLTDNIQTLAAAWAVGEQYVPIVVDLLKRSTMLQNAITAKSTHGIKHKYRYFNSLPEAVFREIGQGIVPQKIDMNTAAIDLKELVFDLYDDYQNVLQYPGGKDAWLRDNSPAAMAGIANSLVKAVFYGNNSTFGYAGAFKGFHQYAKDLGQVVAQKSGASGSRTSIFAVRWDEFDGASLRYNNTELINIMDMTPQQPIPIVTNTTTNEQLDIFKWKFSSYFALVVPSAKSVAAITQIDNTHGPTADEMNMLIEAVNAPNGKTVIFANSLGRRKIAALKDAKLSMYGDANAYNNWVDSWAGKPIVVDDNISSNETTALD